MKSLRVAHIFLLIFAVWLAIAPAIAATMLCDDGCECCNPPQPAAASPSCCNDETPAPERSSCVMYLTDDHGNNSVALPGITLTPYQSLDTQNAAPVAELAAVQPNHASGVVNISFSPFPRSAPIYLQTQSFLC